jgi:hypothetical protein
VQPLAAFLCVILYLAFLLSQSRENDCPKGVDRWFCHLSVLLSFFHHSSRDCGQGSLRRRLPTATGRTDRQSLIDRDKFGHGIA